ncbi:uncharacterized protein LOC111446015 [Cucurbita moschata]|uniref:Uncharacterized protein LOC111446015 n=1 Tax=Cucurbita moschata TaxID=3662 RepID=A0A6J1FJG9_CUCMO|nr:uncharacterized protein LOC111446015 [Cucurbita moschata]
MAVWKRSLRKPWASVCAAIVICSDDRDFRPRRFTWFRLIRPVHSGARKDDRGTWRIRSRCALGLASLILAIEFGDVSVAVETQALESPPQVVDSRRVKISRWSDKRKCAQWRANSLEIIVPENLPRPSQRRKWETIAFTDVENAPAVQVISSKFGSKYCFSL